MVEVDGSENGEIGGNGGGGIEAASHAYFEDDEFAVLLVKIAHGEGEGEFEEGGMVVPVLYEFAEGGEASCDFCFRDLLAGDLNSFAVVYEMGGGEEAGAGAGGAG